MRGEAARLSRQTNRPRNRTAAPAHDSICSDSSGQTEVWFSTKTASSNDGIRKSAPGPSNVSSERSVVRGRISQPAMTAKTAKGTPTQKIDGQPSESSSKPPATGPALMPTAWAVVNQPSALARLCCGTDRTMMAMLLAPSRLAPTPCTARKAIREGRSDARLHSREATPKTVKPTRYRSLRPNISQIRLPTGRKVAKASR